ncbi:hypothetical protein DWU99_06055 [Dyella psychrodurans]|uniref:Uncharacterized protein n=1 Tax=Dyella psychrodurans TaxID=1927960 RepID=A0A370XEJ3_9GAMM|nr:hypothetical protein DWU99_06055 [Dyella psychrodurans]
MVIGSRAAETCTARTIPVLLGGEEKGEGPILHDRNIRTGHGQPGAMGSRLAAIPSPKRRESARKWLFHDNHFFCIPTHEEDVAITATLHR